MHAVITILHVFVCIFLICVVLLQRGRGAQVGAVFGGGGGSTMFGARGAGNFLTKLTTGAAIVFMLTSFSLSYLNITGSSDRLFNDEAAQKTAAPKPLFEEPAAAADAAAPAAAAAPEPQPSQPAPAP
jgi:preprotein translocase subunit SecG